MSRDQLFIMLENILSTLSDIHVMTQNQETIILHSSESDMLPELANNKQEKIAKLNALEGEFEAIYAQCKDTITDKQDIRQLQNLVAKIMETKEEVTKAEEKNRRIWEGKRKPRVKGKPVQKPSSYIVAQYKKHDKQ